MSVFTLSHRAKDDLRAIALFTEHRWGKEQRNLYIKQFDETFRLLAESPGIGRHCDHVKPGYRKFPHGSHIIFYKVAPTNGTSIIRILLKNMDVPSKLADK